MNATNDTHRFEHRVAVIGAGRVDTAIAATALELQRLPGGEPTP
jgi:hypothetical protein